MNKRREIIEIIFVAVFFVAVIIFLSFYGRSFIKYAEPSRIKIIQEPYMAYHEWKDAKIHGRILFLFDRHLNAVPPKDDGTEPALSKDNYVYLAAGNGMLRKIYHVIPDAAWQEVETVLGRYSMVSRSGEIFRMVIGEGVRVYILRAKDIPDVSEKVIMNVNADLWTDAALQGITGALKNGRLSSDLITISGNTAESGMKAITAGHNRT